MNLSLAALVDPLYKRLLACILLGILFLTSCSSLQSQFQKARGMDERGKWNEAVVRYERNIPQVDEKDHSLLAGMYAHLGYCLMTMERTVEALPTVPG